LRRRRDLCSSHKKTRINPEEAKTVNEAKTNREAEKVSRPRE
jgi:hypothetical protein